MEAEVAVVALYKRYAFTFTYYSSTPLLNYSEYFLLLYCTLLSISGCIFPFPVAVFLQSVDELLEVMETWGFAISFATGQPRK